MIDHSLLLNPVAARVGQRPGETEVADANAAVGLDQYVGRLQVPMHDITHVQEGKAAQNIIDKLDQMVLCKVNLVLQQRVEISVHKLDDQANVHEIIAFRLGTLPPLVRRILWTYDLDQLRDE